MSAAVWGGAELDLDAYLARIGYEGPLEPSPETLRALHRAHVRAIPFENLEVWLGRPVPLDLENLQRKLVRQRRGGYCYEHNSLFAAALERLGFDVCALGARVRTAGPTLRAVTHALLRVVVDGHEWLADTGFGGQGLLEPVPLSDGARMTQGGWTFGVTGEPDGVHVLRSLRPQGWVDLYGFAPQPVYPVDFVLMNHYTSTHPLSRFTGQLVVQRTLPDRHLALLRDELTTVLADGSHERRKVSADELPAILEHTFGIVLGAEDVKRLVRQDITRPYDFRTSAGAGLSAPQ
jgi:N-hydroxyarylamine O-acetyltransferase